MIASLSVSALQHNSFYFAPVGSTLGLARRANKNSIHSPKISPTKTSPLIGLPPATLGPAGEEVDNYFRIPFVRLVLCLICNVLVNSYCRRMIKITLPQMTHKSDESLVKFHVCKR